MGKFCDLGGKEFNFLTAKSVVCRGKRTKWLCLCRCGREAVVRADQLKTGHTKSCGCEYERKLKIGMGMKHGHSGQSSKKRTPEYNAWANMHSRCNPKNNNYKKDYYDRGIRVCDTWSGDGGFERFLADMGVRPSKKHSLDRINNNGNYEPENCRWATMFQQRRNCRRVIEITHNGETMCLTDWAHRLGIKREKLVTLLKRLSFPEIAEMLR